jgi:hypothetical protein
VRVILDDRQATPTGDVEDDIHLTGHSRVMHGNDGSRARSDECLQPALIQVERVRTNVGKHRAGAAENEGIDRGHKGEGRHDDLVTGLHVEKESRHLQRVGAGGRQQDPWHTEDLFE